MTGFSTRKGLAVTGTLVACVLAIAVLLQFSTPATLFTGAAHGISSAAGVAAYTVSRSTEHAPLVQCLRHLTGDIRLLFPIPTWSSPCYTTECEALWAGDSKSQNKAWADLRSWIPNVLAAAVRPARYIQLIGFAVMATVLAVIINCARRIALQRMFPERFNPRVLDWRMQVWLLKRAFQSPQLMLTGAASLILLTPPAALAVVANMMANGGALAPFITAGPAELGRICQRMQGLRFLGLVMPIEMLVSNGTLKLVSLLLSAQYLGYRGLWHDINFDGGLHLTFWPAILFDCILHPSTAALMTGPSASIFTVSAAVWGLDGPATFPLRIVAPHGYLHAITCMYMIVLSGLGTFVNLGSLEGGPFQMIVTLYLLWWSFGVPGALFCAVIFGWVQVYAFHTSAKSLHWRLQLLKRPVRQRPVRQGPVRRTARTVLHTVWRCLGGVLQVPAIMAQTVRQSNCASVPTREKTAGAARGGSRFEGKSRSRSKASKGTKGSSSKPVAKEAAPSHSEQPEKQPASQTPSEPQAKPAAAPPHSDGSASLQQMPPQAKLPPQTADDKSEDQAPNNKDESASLQQEEFTEPQIVQQTAQARKQKAARRRAAKNRGATLQMKPSESSDSLSAISSTADAQEVQDAQTAAAEVSAVAIVDPVTQPPIAERTLHRLSSQGPPAPQPAPEPPHLLQQIIPETAMSALSSSSSSSSSSAASEAVMCGPCPPNAPGGQPTSARPAPVKATLQHGMSSPACSGPAPLHALLPGSSPEPLDIQALLGVRPAEQIKAQSRTPQQKSHAEAQQDTETVPDPEDKMVASKGNMTQQDRTCIMCWETPRQATLAPCGHRALCLSCTQILLKAPEAVCPICRSGVQCYILKEFDV